MGNCGSENLCLDCACEAHLIRCTSNNEIGGLSMQNGSIMRTERRRGPDVWEIGGSRRIQAYHVMTGIELDVNWRKTGKRTFPG